MAGMWHLKRHEGLRKKHLKSPNNCCIIWGLEYNNDNRIIIIIFGGGISMQRQYKLYRIDKDATDDTLSLLSKYNFVKLSDYIVAIQYDYLNNGYKELLESMSNVMVSQYIFTTSVFYKLLTYFVSNELRVYEIKLSAVFEEDNLNLLNSINKINRKEDIENSLSSLLEILKWYNYDEGIDISHMSFGMKYITKYCRFHFFNNGILAIDSEDIIQPLVALLKNVM